MSIAALNDQLLAPEADPDAGPKRGSKDDLISKILKLHEEQDVPLEYSNTKLKRMSKKELAGVLGGMLQQAATCEAPTRARRRTARSPSGPCAWCTTWPRASRSGSPTRSPRATGTPLAASRRP